MGEREASEERLNGGGGEPSGAAPLADAGANGDAGAAENGGDPTSPGANKPQGGGLRMWRAARDRAAWKADVINVRLKTVF